MVRPALIELRPIRKKAGLTPPCTPKRRKAQGPSGDRDGALRSLERAYEQHWPWLNFMACEPAFDPFRADPRFQKLSHQIGL
jgi:hypothetical protein